MLRAARMSSPAVTFLTGYSSRRGALGLLTFPDALAADAQFCRMFAHADGRWGTLDLPFQCRSIASTLPPDRRAWWVLGKNGEVVEIAGGAPSFGQIEGAGLASRNPLGYVEAINNIGGTLYVCGYGRQVYRRVDGHWRSIADEIVTHEAGVGFFAIDGVDREHVYAVGWRGEIYLHDGHGWHRDESPTTAHLAALRCVGPDEVWICGDRGVVLHGRFGRWRAIDTGGYKNHWSSLEVFAGRVYLAGDGVFACIEDGQIRPVETGRAAPVHRLHAREGLLWAIGRANILCFDGEAWTELVHPDNV